MAGIESPGLTSAPAIAEEILNILDNAGLELLKNETFNAERKAIIIKKEFKPHKDKNEIEHDHINVRYLYHSLKLGISNNIPTCNALNCDL